MDTTVLLVIDVQRGVVERFAEDPGYLERLSRAITAARGAGIAVVYAAVAFRPGHPEISARNQTFSAVAAAGRFVEGSPATEIHPAVAPAPGDVVVTKRRVSEPGRCQAGHWRVTSAWSGCRGRRTRKVNRPAASTRNAER